MKHLSKFNELTSQVYRRAANELDKLGGIHKRRASDLADYAVEIEMKKREDERLSNIEKAKLNGTFLLNAEVIKTISDHKPSIGTKSNNASIEILNPGTYRKWKDNPALGRKNFSISEEAPIDVYISDLYVDDWMEMGIEDFIQDKTALGMEVIVVSNTTKYACGIFKIYVGLEWDTSSADPVFSIKDNVYIGNSWNDDLCLKFADRKSAVKFKNLLKYPKNLIHQGNLEYLRELFMTYSTAADMDKYFEMLGKLNINLLYN